MHGTLLEVALSKKCTPLWRETHFQVKMYKTLQLRSTFRSCAVEKVHAVVARSTFRSQHVQNTEVRTTFGRSDAVSRGRRKGLCTLSKWAKREGFVAFFNYSHHYTTLHSNTLHFTSLQLQLHLHYIPLHYTPLQSTTLHYTQLHSITFNYTQLHYTTLHYTTQHYTTTTTTPTPTTTTTTTLH